MPDSAVLAYADDIAVRRKADRLAAVNGRAWRGKPDSCSAQGRGCATKQARERFAQVNRPYDSLKVNGWGFAAAPENGIPGRGGNWFG